MNKKKKFPHMGAWLEVDDEDKEVRYRVDPSWEKNTSDEEQSSVFTNLTALVEIYRRAGYTIIDIVKKLKK
ncbi:MAG: hypothetical protein PVJ21_11755 [Anaerolineales bacterium]